MKREICESCNASVDLCVAVVGLSSERSLLNTAKEMSRIRGQAGQGNGQLE